MSVYRNGAPFPATVFEAAALHYSIKVFCGRCPNTVVFEPAGVWWHFHRRGWSDGLGDARKRFWCTQCALGGVARARPKRIEAVRERYQKALPPPDDREWKRHTRRFRT